MVSRLDRLSRKIHDAYDVMDPSQRMGWALVALDLGLDMTTPMGSAMAGVAAVFRKLERRSISQQTRDALAAKRAEGALGRPRVVAMTPVTASHRALTESPARLTCRQRRS